MTLSLYRASIPVYLRGLTVLSALLQKGEDFAAAEKLDPETLLQARLAPDMLPLTGQIQRASDSAKGGTARLSGLAVPSFADDEVTFADLQARIAKTIAFLETVSADSIDGSTVTEVNLKFGRKSATFVPTDFLFNFSLPNFYFHVTTAYAILRHKGVAVGKMDFLGSLPLVDNEPAA